MFWTIVFAVIVAYVIIKFWQVLALGVLVVFWTAVIGGAVWYLTF